MYSDKLVPEFILEELSNGQKNGRFSAACLFIDTSGFTPLTSQLMQHGKAGAEILADVLATLFKPLLKTVYNNGGFISGFAGDGLKAVFPLENSTRQENAQRAAVSAWQMHQYMSENHTVTTQFGAFSFAAKVAVAIGDVEWGIWEGEDNNDPYDQYRAYYIEGPALADCLLADAYAVAGDVLFTQTIMDVLPAEQVQASLKDGFWFVDHLALSAEFKTAVSPPPTPYPEAIIDSFYPSDRLPQTLGEFRRVVTTFINLQTLPDQGTFPALFFRLLNQYGGYLCRIGRIGDQDLGGTIHIFWGAPEVYENDISRALNFALDLRRLSSVKMRIGISSNMAFAGYIGGEERTEYTCYSSYVNLAARQMVLAGWDDIIVDSETAAYAIDHFIFEDRGLKPFKGFDHPRPVIALKSKQGSEREPFFRGDLIGRVEETAVLERTLHPLIQGNYAGVIGIIGEAGIGKSRLVHEFYEHSSVLESSDLFLCQTDEVLRQSLNPFRYMLRQLFNQSATATESVNAAHFNDIFDHLVDDTTDPNIQAELQRTKPFLGRLLGFTVPEKEPTLDDQSLGFENTLLGLKTLIIRLCQDSGLVLHLEDAHWLDADSKTFIKLLFRNVQQYPLALIITSREPLPDDLFDPLSEEPQAVLTLRPLPNDNIHTFIEDRLVASVASSVVDALTKRTDGNPFFMEQLLLYWQENNLLTHNKKNQIVLKEAAEEVPFDVRTILVARIDQLLQEIRDVVQTAAILGREFELAILSHMLKGDIELTEKVHQAEQAAIWSAITEMQYLFKHALMRDTAYEMQLQSRLRHLHLLAAEAIQQLFANDLPLWSPDLAYHFDQAKDVDQAVYWHEIAGDQALKLFANTEADEHYERIIELLPESAYEKRFDVLLKREYTHLLLGDRDAQKEDLALLKTIVAQLADGSQVAHERETEYTLRYATYLDLISQAVETAVFAQTAVSLAEKSNDYYRLAQAYITWGKALWPQSLIEEAKEKLTTALQISQEHNFRDLEAKALRFLGVALDLQGLFKESRQASRAAQAIYQETNILDGVASTFNNIGVSYMKQGDYKKSYSALLEALTIHKKTGSRAGASWSLANLGSVSLQMGEYEQSEQFFLEVNEVFIELGDFWSQSMAQGFLGNIAAEKSQFSKALMHHTNALNGFEQLGYRQGVGNAKAAMGSLWRRIGQYGLGISLLSDSLVIFEDIKAHRNLDQGLLTRALIYHLQGAHETAVIDAEKAVEGARKREDRHLLAFALTHLGDAQVALGNLDTAVATYQEALALRQAVQEDHLKIDTMAGLANAYQHQNKLEEARQLVNDILAYINAKSTDGVNRPSNMYWVCYQILEKTDDPRATAVLTAAHAYLNSYAATIEDDTYREQFWNNVEANRLIKEAFQKSKQ